MKINKDIVKISKETTLPKEMEDLGNKFWHSERKVEYGGYTTTLYLKRNMAGGEKKRVSPIDSEMMRERLRRMEERMHGPVEQEAAAVDEAEVELAPAAETTPSGISGLLLSRFLPSLVFLGLLFS